MKSPRGGGGEGGRVGQFASEGSGTKSGLVFRLVDLRVLNSSFFKELFTLRARPATAQINKYRCPTCGTLLVRPASDTRRFLMKLKRNASVHTVPAHDVHFPEECNVVCKQRPPSYRTKRQHFFEFRPGPEGFDPPQLKDEAISLVEQSARRC